MLIGTPPQVIQGTSDISPITQTELSQTIDFCSNAFDGVKPQAQTAVLQKMQSVVNAAPPSSGPQDPTLQARLEALKESLSGEEQRAVDFVRARQVLRTEDTMQIGHFSTDVINGLVPDLRRGHLTLMKAVSPSALRGGSGD